MHLRRDDVGLSGNTEKPDTRRSEGDFDWMVGVSARPSLFPRRRWLGSYPCSVGRSTASHHCAARAKRERSLKKIALPQECGIVCV